MTAVFDKHGLNFQYPENWEIHESYARDQVLEVYLVAPSGAFWSVMAFGAEFSGEALMQNILVSLQQQYEGFESEPVRDALANIPLEGHNAHFFCLDLLVSTKMRTLQVDRHRLLIMSQAESREFEKQERVFDAISTSLLDGLQRPAR
jgi:hypothetical protein